MLSNKDKSLSNYRAALNRVIDISNSNSNIDTLRKYNEILDTLSEISTMSNTSQLTLEYALSQHRCALDIGGTLAKIVFLQPVDKNSNKFLCSTDFSYQSLIVNSNINLTDDDYHLYLSIEKDNKKSLKNKLNFSKLSIPVSSTENLCFKYFDSKDIDSLVNFILKNKLVNSNVSILNVTGGGAYKYSSILSDKLKVNLKKVDEMTSIMKGLSFALTLSNSVFKFDIEKKCRIPVNLTNPIYPFLVVNIGSGVSILKANSDEDFTRITGTCVGGGTVLGLAKLIFGAKSFHEVASLSEIGEDSLDLTVRDLLGENFYHGHSLSLNLFASSFGKVFLMDQKLQGKELKKNIKKSDIARSLIRMVSYNIGYLAYLVGSLYNVHKVFFTGKYIDNHSFTMESITYGVNFYHSSYSTSLNYPYLINDTPFLSNINSYPNDSKQSTSYVIEDNTKKLFEVYFLKHDGYLGALGSFLN